MTISPVVESVIADLRARLVQNLNDGILDLTDEVIGEPVLAPLLHTAALDVSAAEVDLSVPDAVTVRGTADLFGSPQVHLELTFTLEDGALTGALTLSADDHPVQLSGVVSTVANGAGLPPEVPDLGLAGLSVSITPHTGAFLLSAVCTVPWTLPFGGDGLPVDRVSIELQRAGEPGAPVRVALGLSSSTAYPVGEDVEVTAKDLRFQYDGTAGWTLGGTLAADVLGTAIDLSATLTSTPERREFKFTAETALSVDLTGAGTLTANGLSLSVARTPEGEYSWTVEADGAVDLLDAAIMAAGTLGLEYEGGSARLTLSPPADGDLARVTVPLPAAPCLAVHLGLDKLEIARGAGKITAEAETVVWFSGLPGELGTVLPGSRETAVAGTFAVTTGADAAVSFTVEPVLPMQAVHLPSFSVGTFHLDLRQAPAAVEVGHLEVAWTRNGGVSVGADLGVGIPAELNEIFGTGHDVLVTYDGTAGSLVRVRLAAAVTGGSPSLRLHPLNSPLKSVDLEPVEPGSDQRRATVDLGESGTLSLLVPDVEVQGDTVRVRGGFTQQGLAIPLSPLKSLLGALGLDAVNPFLPDRLPLEDVSLYDDVTGLDVDALLNVIMTALNRVAGIDLPDADEVRAVLHQIAARATMLPERLKPYLSVTIPEELSFDVTLTAEGGLLGGVSVATTGDPATTRATATPLRILLPGLSVTGPTLTGLELWNLQIGEIFGGAALLVRADLNVDQFDLAPLAALLALPADAAAALPDPRKFTRRLVAENVTIVVVPELFVAVPVFFDDLGVEYRGIEDAEFGGHLSLPEPQLNLSQARDLYNQFADFFTDPDATLSAEAIGSHGLDLRFTAGPLFLQLPGYAGGTTLGSRTATTGAGAAANLAALFNGLKKLNVADLLNSLPAALRHAPPATKPQVHLGPIGFEAGWDIDTPDGTVRGLLARLTGTAALGPFAQLITTLDVQTDGRDGFQLGFTGDGAINGVVDLHLAGTAGNLPATATGNAAVLQFADPAARVTTTGPAGQPDTFTVEWWTCPTALRNYNQFISGADVWGSFAFHTTDTGAVYCGTDVGTRFTPNEIPAGTVQLNTWQHFAFTYSYGTGTLYRNGVQIARKDGLTAPAPWTGMRLGIPDQGSQPDGFVADLRVWNVCRTADDIRSGMGHRLTGRETGLTGYWPLDDGSGSVVRDLGPSGFDGTASHTTWAGAGTVQAPPPQANGSAGTAAVARVTGRSRLSVFDRTVFTGDVALAADQATLSGRLDLFPDNDVLTVRGNLDGAVDAQHLTLHGNAAVDLAGLSLARAGLTWTDTTLTLGGRWFDLFDTTLTLQTATDHVVLTGTVSGSRKLDVSFGRVLVHPLPGTVQVADGFHFDGAFAFSLTVTADEHTGLNAQGQITFTANGTPFSLPIWFPSAPTSLEDLDQLIIRTVQSISVTLFKKLYSDGAAWAKGVADGAISWARDQWQMTGQALQIAYNEAAPQVAKILDTAGFGVAEIGHVLRATYTEFAADPAGTVIGILKQADFPVVKVGNVIAGGFQELVSTANRDATVQDLTRLMHGQYSALDMVQVAVAAGITPTSAVGILKRTGGYAAQDLADAAHIGFNLDHEHLIDVLSNVVSITDIITSVGRIFGTSAKDIARYLYDKGEARLSDINDALRALGIPLL
jgi:hypothetical protein